MTEVTSVQRTSADVQAQIDQLDQAVARLDNRRADLERAIAQNWRGDTTAEAAELAEIAVKLKGATAEREQLGGLLRHAERAAVLTAVSAVAKAKYTAYQRVVDYDAEIAGLHEQIEALKTEREKVLMEGRNADRHIYGSLKDNALAVGLDHGAVADRVDAEKRKFPAFPAYL